MTPGTADYPQALGRLSQSPSPMSASLLRTARNPVPRSVLSGGLASRVGGQQVFPLDLLPAAEIVDALDNGAVPHEPVMCLLHAPLQQRRVKQGEKLRVGILGPAEYCPEASASRSSCPISQRAGCARSSAMTVKSANSPAIRVESSRMSRSSGGSSVRSRKVSRRRIAIASAASTLQALSITPCAGPRR
jgi:hypothetical protein